MTEEERKGKWIYLGKDLSKNYYLNFKGSRDSWTNAVICESIEDVANKLSEPEKYGLTGYLRKGRKFGMIVDEEISNKDILYLIKERRKKRFNMGRLIRDEEEIKI